MAKIVKPPKYKEVECDKCKAIISYLPEDVRQRTWTDYGGGPGGYKRVKCPRKGCTGHGYVEQW